MLNKLYFLSLVYQEAESPVTCSSEGLSCADGIEGIIDNIFTLELCRAECLASPDCQFLTFLHDSAGTFACFLFSSCETVQECDPATCVSEPRGCDN